MTFPQGERRLSIREAKPMPSRSAADRATDSLVRSATPADAETICALVNAWADEGLTLRRTPSEIENNIGEFVVAEVARDVSDDRSDSASIVACGALAVFSPSLAEIRSVAVDPASKGTGAGRRVVEFMLDIAHLLEMDEVCLLTKVPGFFARFGFRTIEPSDLPASFLDEAIAGRGRTIAGRTVMLRELLG